MEEYPMTDRTVYRVEYMDNQYEVKLKNSIFKNYEDALDYFNEKVLDYTGRYSKVKLIKFEIVETETVLLELED